MDGPLTNTLKNGRLQCQFGAGEVYCVNLIHVVAMWRAGQVTKVRLSDRFEMEVKQSP
jgi:hypothetical protein